MQYSGVSASTLLVDERDPRSAAALSINDPYVLVIDDDEDIVNVIMLLLEIEAYFGIGLSDSLKVLDLLEQLDVDHLPSVILLDLMMPGLSGYDIAMILSQNERLQHIPIIIMTADSRVQGASSIQGAIDYIAKPFNLEPLLVKLRFYLDPHPLTEL
ncbi:MAG TPA: response regulator [Ktedonobacteraceae bacterium]|nr:response regulator [Ktedonobacteraceae bacterium]